MRTPLPNGFVEHGLYVKGVPSAMIRYRYSAWDGSQEVLPPAPGDVLDNLTDYSLQGGDLSKALRMLMQRGLMGRQGRVTPGLQDLLNTLRGL